MSGFENDAAPTPNHELLHSRLGQSYPQHCPQLGAPLSIRETAQLIGCSAWTVRQRYVPLGLPHLRSGRQGKLIFYRDQVVHWILQHQQKGGHNHEYL